MTKSISLFAIAALSTVATCLTLVDNGTAGAPHSGSASISGCSTWWGIRSKRN